MAKAQGIIGNFKGKVGNMVGYQLTDSNNKQTQGIRIYQPNVKNPKTSAQAEQRAKLAPINATYRALKMIIDRGNEGLPYGNKSRLAWLKQAFKAQLMPWFKKGSYPDLPVGCQITKGSLNSISYLANEETLEVTVNGLLDSTDISTVGKFTTAILAGISSLKEGDQLTVVGMYQNEQGTMIDIRSFVLDTTSNDAQNFFTAAAGKVQHDFSGKICGYSLIVSREGANGEHLRSNEFISIPTDVAAEAPYNADSKTAAIASYMASGAANTDWPQESID